MAQVKKSVNVWVVLTDSKGDWYKKAEVSVSADWLYEYNFCKASNARATFCPPNPICTM